MRAGSLISRPATRNRRSGISGNTATDPLPATSGADMPLSEYEQRVGADEQQLRLTILDWWMPSPVAGAADLSTWPLAY